MQYSDSTEQIGPYKLSTLNYVLSEEERRTIAIDDLLGPLCQLFQSKDEIDATQVLLRRLQGGLRTDPGVNAFLAVDVDADTDDVDAVTQRIEYARCSNATAFVVPFLGHNFDVGEEAGSILENVADTHGDRLLFVHEATVTSTMIRSTSVRWDLRVDTYEAEVELCTNFDGSWAESCIVSGAKILLGLKPKAVRQVLESVPSILGRARVAEPGQRRSA